MKIRAQKTVSRELFWWLHIIFFGILGVLMVFFLDSGATIRLLCESLLSEKRPGILSALLRPEVLEALLLYGKCFIWSYELVFCLAFLLHGSLHGLKTAFAIAEYSGKQASAPSMTGISSCSSITNDEGWSSFASFPGSLYTM